jgi:hypothetical protein
LHPLGFTYYNVFRNTWGCPGFDVLVNVAS